ncbi:oocyte zinc finger protein XlCOF28-like [Dermacentor albipictus]|uniref:oocyte zinc finger protein XlCOF28-like n=1 Tax=Dermacentor albipictus TaxID=60249 RepID=UPI0038FCFAF0
MLSTVLLGGACSSTSSSTRLGLERVQVRSPFADWEEQGLSVTVNNAVTASPSETDNLLESTQMALPAGALRYRCIYCPYATRQRASLVVHERVHTGERPFRCHVCNRGFAHRSHVARHMRTHTGERPFSCPLCPAAFAQRSDVKVHMRTHNPHSGGHRRQAPPANVGSVVLVTKPTGVSRRRHSTGLCHVGMKKIVVIIINVRVERGAEISLPWTDLEEQDSSAPVDNVGSVVLPETAGPSLLPEERPRPPPAGAIVPHQCRFCPYATWQKFRLAVHERVHTGERPHRCHVCSRAFAQSAHLVGHMRSHTGERPFRCHVCNRGFAQNSDVVRHMRSHTGERPYSCPHCPAVFAQRSSAKITCRSPHRCLGQRVPCGTSASTARTRLDIEPLWWFTSECTRASGPFGVTCATAGSRTDHTWCATCARTLASGPSLAHCAPPPSHGVALSRCTCARTTTRTVPDADDRAQPADVGSVVL